MRSRATLGLIEQIVMVLVFALVAVLCIQMFVLSEKLLVKYEATDRAVLEAQNAAEMIKKSGIACYVDETKAVQTGEDTWCVYFDSDWNATDKGEREAYYLELISADTDNIWLWKADIVVYAVSQTELFRISVAGQK